MIIIRHLKQIEKVSWIVLAIGVLLFIVITSVSASNFNGIHKNKLNHYYTAFIDSHLVLVHNDPTIDSEIRGNKICTKQAIYYEKFDKRNKKWTSLRMKTPTFWSKICFDASDFKSKRKNGYRKIRVGEHSDIYELVDIVVYKENNFNITCSLKNYDGTYEMGNAWINNNTLKFGYNLSNSTWKNRKYECYSVLPIKRIGDEFYFKNGKNGYKINTKDICDQYNPETEKSSECKYKTWLNNSLYYFSVNFYGNSTDPLISIEQIESNLILNQTRWEQENFTHLMTNDVVAYYPFDYGTNITIRDYSNNDNDLSSNFQSDSYANYVNGVIGNALNTSYVSTSSYGVEYSTSSYPEFNQNTDFTFSYWVNTNKPFYSKFYDSANLYDRVGFGFDSMDSEPFAFVSNFSIYDDKYIGSVTGEGIDINSKGYVFVAMTSYFLKVYKYNSTTNKLDYISGKDDGTYVYYPSVINDTKVAVYSSDDGYRIYLYDFNGTSLNLIQNTTAYFNKRVRQMQSVGNYLFEISYYGGLGVWEWNGTELIKKGNYTSSIIDSRDMKVYKTDDDEYTIFSASGGHYYIYKYNLTSDEVILKDTGEAPSASEYGIDYDSKRGLVFGNGNGDLDVFSWDGTNLNLLGHFDTGIINNRDRYGSLYYDNNTQNIIMQRYYIPTMIYKYNETTNKISFQGRIFESKQSVWKPKYYDGKMITLVYRDLYLSSYYNSNGLQYITSATGNLNNLIVSYNHLTKNMKLYLNGINVGEKNINVNFNTAGTVFHLTGNIYMHLNGQMDDVLILNKTITDTEAQEIYNEQYQKFYDYGTATTTPTNITIGNNRINLTLNSQQFNGTEIEAKIGYSQNNITYQWTAYQTYSSGKDTHTFNISNNTQYVKANIKYLSNTYNSYSPLTYNKINLTFFNVEETPTVQQSNGIYINAKPSWTQTYHNTSLINCSSDNLTPILYLDGSAVSNPYNTTYLPAGSFTFQCNVTETAEFYANSTSNIFTLNKNPSPCDLFFNDTSPLTYGQTFKVWTNCNTNFTLFRNKTIISNNSIQSLSVGSYLYEVNRTDTENYTNTYDSSIFVINKATSKVYLYLNKTHANITIENNTAIWINSTIITGQKSNSYIEIWKNNTLLKNESNTYYSEINKLFDQTGLWKIMTYYSGNSNYTSASDIFYVNVTAPLPPMPSSSEIALYLNGNRKDITITINETVIINSTLIKGNASYSYIEIWNSTSLLINQSNVSSIKTSETFGTTGTYKITTYYSGNPDYYSSSESHNIVVTNTNVSIDTNIILFTLLFIVIIAFILAGG